MSINVENLYIPRVQGNWGTGTLGNNFQHEWSFNIEGSIYAKEKLRQALGSTTSDKIKKVYLHRKPEINTEHFKQFGINRFYNNQAEFDQYLLGQNFLAVDPSYISIADLNYILSKAEVVVSIHGAGMANIIFTNPEVKIIEVRPSTFKPGDHPYANGGIDFQYMSKCWGYKNYHVIFADSDTPEHQIIDLKQVEEALMK